MAQAPRWARAPVLVGIVALMLLPGLFYGLPSGKAVLGADRLLRGEVPYRDFWSMYAPGQFVLVAGVFRWVARELWAQGLVAIAIELATVRVLFGILRTSGSSARFAFWISLGYGASRVQAAPEVTSYPGALLGILLGVRAVQASLERTSGGRWLLLAGVCLGVAAGFKHDVAAYGALALGLAIFLARTPGSSRGGAARSVGVLWGTAGACVLVQAVALGYLAGTAAWRDLVLWPALDFAVVRREPFPAWIPPLDLIPPLFEDAGNLRRWRTVARLEARWLLCYLPQVLWIAGLMAALRRNRDRDPQAGLALGFALIGIPLYWAAAHVQQNTHLVSMAVAGLWLSGAWMSRVGAWGRRAIGVFAGLTIFGLLEPAGEELWLAQSGARRSVPLGIEGASGIRVSRHEASYVRPIVEFVQANVPADEAVYVGIQRHDLPVVGNLRLPFLFNRPVAARTHEIHPGITDDSAVQAEVIGALEEGGVRCVVLWEFGGSNPAFSVELRTREMEQRRLHDATWGSRDLDRYLQETFEEVGAVDEYRVYWRRGMKPKVAFGE